MDGTPIYQCGDASYTKHFAQDSAGQWHYRITNKAGHFGRWIPCERKPDYAWFNPRAGKAKIQSPRNENAKAQDATSSTRNA